MGRKEYQIFEKMFYATVLFLIVPWVLYFTDVPSNIQLVFLGISIALIVLSINSLGWFRERLSKLSVFSVLVDTILSLLAIYIVNFGVLFVFRNPLDIKTLGLINSILLFAYLCFRISVTLFPNEIISYKNSVEANIPNFKNYHIAKHHANIEATLFKYTDMSILSYSSAINELFRKYRCDTKTKNYILEQLMLNQELQNQLNKLVEVGNTPKKPSEIKVSIAKLTLDLRRKTCKEVERLAFAKINEPLVKTSEII